jgi:hypothetical protein
MYAAHRRAAEVDLFHAVCDYALAARKYSVTEASAYAVAEGEERQLLADGMMVRGYLGKALCSSRVKCLP